MKTTRRYSNGWVNALFALVFVAVPAFIGYIFWLPDWSADKQAVWFYWVVALAFVIYAGLFTFIMIKLEFLGLDALTFNIPMALVLASIFVTYDWGHGGWWALRALVIIVMVLVAWPLNTYVYYLGERKRQG